MELKIEKLSDIAAWADGKIRDGGYYEEKYRSDATTAYCNVKAYELWKIRDVVLESMERHSVYTSALNEDIASKAAKIDLLEKELDETYKAWDTDSKKHQKREMTLVGEIAKKNRDIEYRKDQERIRTNQLRATESKVEELWRRIEELTDNCRSKSTEIARLRKEMADIKHELSKEDDHGRAGFKRYIEYLIEEEERAVPERFKERLNEEITTIFTKEEETEVNDIPCGEDSIE